MIKAFISHSSRQKKFVYNLVEELGRDYCIVDCYDFEPAYKTVDEVYRKINQSTVFVLLLSKESLNSDWVQKEIRLARNKLEVDDFRNFWPFIIDDLSIEECPEWMWKDQCFNLRKFKSPKMLAHDIEQKFRKIIWEKDKKRKQLETILVGRNSDVENFEEIYLSARGIKLKALIVSGRDGVGKDMFISKCLDKIGYGEETVPYRINIGNKEGIENLIIQLNLITQTFDESQILSVLQGSISEKANIAARLVNKLLDTNAVITIDDDMACVLPNRHLADWLVELVGNSNLCNKLGLFIKSKVILNSFSEVSHPAFGHINLKPLDYKDRVKLFYSLMRIYGLSDIDESDVKWFVSKLLLSPSQLVKAVDKLSNLPLVTVKRDIDTLISWGDEKIKPMLSHFFNDEECKHLLIILSRLDFVSYGILEDFFEERTEEIMAKIYDMMDFGIVSVFGRNDEFFRLDHYFSDYIKRCRIGLPADLESRLEEVLEKKIALSSGITEDVSVYLYEKKRLIISGKGQRGDFLIPSVVVASVIEIYNKRDYEQVVRLCDMVLNDVHNYFPEQERELRYWLCLALARTVNERFFEEVKKINGVENSFLRGFYHRNAMEYIKAERYFRNVLEDSPKMQRAKRELVTVLLAQKKFNEALEMAKENYESNPENSYQIHGYFRCLVRKRPLSGSDIKVLEELMHAMNDNLSDKHEEMSAAMNIEYQYLVKNIGVMEMLQLINEAEARFPNSINVKRAAQSYKFRQDLITKEDVLPEDC